LRGGLMDAQPVAIHAQTTAARAARTRA
jgi:hypothetical protein